MIGHRRGNRRRAVSVGAAVLLAAASVGFVGPHVGADDGPGIPDVPSLGFSIDPARGEVGSTVTGQIDVDDVAEHCITDPEAFTAQFVDLDNPTQPLTPYTQTAEEFNKGVDFVDGDPALILASTIATFFPIGVAMDLNAAEPEGLAESAIEATMIMGFADLATASPIAPYGNFDPTSGDGATPVPDLDGGTQVVIATCVGLPEEITLEAYGAAVKAGEDYIRANYDEPFDELDMLGIAPEVAPAILEKLVEPKALGIATFCVDDGEGSCDEAPDDHEPNGEPGRPDNGVNEGGGTGDSGNAKPATPVTGSPNYTG